MHWCPFWYERGRIGGVFGFLSLWSDVYALRCMTPPPPSGVFWVFIVGVFLGIAMVFDWNRMLTGSFCGSFLVMEGLSCSDV